MDRVRAQVQAQMNGTVEAGKGREVAVGTEGMIPGVEVVEPGTVEEEEVDKDGVEDGQDIEARQCRLRDGIVK